MGRQKTLKELKEALLHKSMEKIQSYVLIYAGQEKYIVPIGNAKHGWRYIHFLWADQKLSVRKV